jgi:hypothetical protein
MRDATVRNLGLIKNDDCQYSHWRRVEGVFVPCYIRTMLYSYHVSYIVLVEGVMHQAFATVLVEPNFLLREGQFS